jgi:DNA-binding response OmpR family regulator
VVDDEEGLRRLLFKVLVQEGFDVSEAENGRQALHVFASQPADVVITDMLMPDMDGLELILLLRRQLSTVRIIGVTGNATAGASLHLDIAGKFGADRTFSKPFDLPILVNAIRELAAV